MNRIAPCRADDASGWPQANGPFGNFNPRQYGVHGGVAAAAARSERGSMASRKGSASEMPLRGGRNGG